MGTFQAFCGRFRIEMTQVLELAIPRCPKPTNEALGLLRLEDGHGEEPRFQKRPEGLVPKLGAVASPASPHQRLNWLRLLGHFKDRDLVPT